MCCMLTSLFFLGPRIAILVWWLVDQVRFEMAFDSFWVAFVGWLLGAAKGYAAKLVNPGGVEVWKHHPSGNVSGIDTLVDGFDRPVKGE